MFKGGGGGIQRRSLGGVDSGKGRIDGGIFLDEISRKIMGVLHTVVTKRGRITTLYKTNKHDAATSPTTHPVTNQHRPVGS